MLRLAKFLLILLLMFNAIAFARYPSSRPYDNNWYIRVDESESANSDRKSYDPPAVGTKAKELNKFQRILLRANKQRPSQFYRYEPHISNREYIDCSYYKYVDCSNFTFCRCWQCKDYVYPVVRTNY